LLTTGGVRLSASARFRLTGRLLALRRRVWS
jgi:hypothetical protein